MKQVGTIQQFTACLQLWVLLPGLDFSMQAWTPATYIQVGDTTVNLPSVAIGCTGARWRWQFPTRDAPCVPVGPVDLITLDIHIHRSDADILISLEGRFIGRVGIEWIHAADLVVISNVKYLVFRSWKWREGAFNWPACVHCALLLEDWGKPPKLYKDGEKKNVKRLSYKESRAGSHPGPMWLHHILTKKIHQMHRYIQKHKHVQIWMGWKHPFSER